MQINTELLFCEKVEWKLHLQNIYIFWELFYGSGFEGLM